VDTGDPFPQVTNVVWRNYTLWSGVNQNQITVHWVRCRNSGGNVTVGGEGITAGTHTYYTMQ
jgi:hypothetical protein